MAGTVLKAMIGPSVHRPRTSEIKPASEQLPLAAGSLRATPQRWLLQQKSCSKFGAAAVTHMRPDLAVRSRMVQSAAAPIWAVSLCDRLETMIFTSETKTRRGPESSPQTEMNHYLSDNFEPVPEMAPTAVQDLHVSGTIPVCLHSYHTRGGFLF